MSENEKTAKVSTLVFYGWRFISSALMLIIASVVFMVYIIRGRKLQY